MSYECGLSPSVAYLMNEEPHGPRVVCDSCGSKLNIREDRPPPKWFLDGKSPPGWRTTRDGDKRDDRCPRCKT